MGLKLDLETICGLYEGLGRDLQPFQGILMGLRRAQARVVHGR